MQQINFEVIRSKKFALPLIGLLIFAAIIAGVYATVSLTPGSSDNESDTNEEEGQFIANKTILYGTWTEESSEIYMYDLTDSKEYLAATLPSEIKDVSFISPNKLIYIANTNIQDHGTEIAEYNLDTKQTSTLVRADDGFGIDDYVLSQNSQYIATWEVQLDTESGTLLNGNSRVKTVDLASPNVKNTIYDEIATRDTPVRYPLAITNSGTVIMDRFVPLASRGWAYGMSISDFTGAQRQDISSMAAGTYGTQPKLSPDETKMLFSGYDGALGPGQDQQDGFRRATILTNTIESLDIATGSREKYTQFDNTNLYLSPTWNGNTAVVSVGKKGSLDFGTYLAQSTNSQTTTLSIPDISTADIITFLSPTMLLTGTQFQSATSIGNLGENYSALYDDLAIKDTQGNTHNLALSNNLVQYITTLDGSVSNIGFDSNKIEPVQISAEQKQLRLQTFIIKPTLPPVREEQQSNPPQQPDPQPKPQNPTPTDSPGFKPSDPGQVDPVEKDCQHNSNPCNLVICKKPATAKCGELDFSAPDWQETKKCHAEFEKQEIAEGNCWDSPLYLYGKKGTNVSVKVNTPIYNSSLPYNESYNLTLLENGKFTTGTTIASSISYDYKPAIRKIIPPTKGAITSRKNLDTTLALFAQKLSLNQKETKDLIEEAYQKVSSPYVFVSFFDHDTSSAILPLQFSPKPDSYRNIVFYFRQYNSKPSTTPSLPVFDPIKRYGFTAVEISTLVE